MDMDLTPYDVELIRRIIAARPAGIVETIEEADFLLDFVNAMENCAEVGSTLHLSFR